MERQKISLKKFYIPFIIIIYAVGITGHLLPATRNLMLQLTPYTLLMNGIITLSVLSTEDKKKFYLWSAGVFIFTWLIEFAGVHTGLIFGEYKYGATLGLKILETPVLIGMNWLIIAAGAISISERATGNVVLNVLLTGILAVLIDILIEPCAAVLGYWSWSGDVIPFKNYAAWFAISMLLHLLYRMLKVKITSNEAAVYFIVQFIFFVVIRGALVQEKI